MTATYGMFTLAFVLVLAGLGAMIATYFKPIPWFFVMAILIVAGFLVQLFATSGGVVHF